MSRILLGAVDSWRGENEITCINSSIQQKLTECLLYPRYGGNVETCNNLSWTLCRTSWEHFHNQCFVWTSCHVMKWVWGVAISIVWWENWGSAKVPDSPKTINLRRREAKLHKMCYFLVWCSRQDAGMPSCLYHRSLQTNWDEEDRCTNTSQLSETSATISDSLGELTRLRGQSWWWLITVKGFKAKSAKEEGPWGAGWRRPGISFQESSTSGVPQDILNSPGDVTTRVKCCLLGKHTRDSMLKVFIEGWSHEQSLPSMY